MPFAVLMQSAGDALRPVLDSFWRMWIGFLGRTPHLVLAVVVLAIGSFLSRPLAGMICRGMPGKRLHQNLAEVLSRLVRVSVVVVSILIAAVIAFPTFRPGDLVAGVGITSVAIGFAFKDILQNFFAGILILWREPFRVGDEIRSGEYEGRVEDINSRSTRIRTYDGELAVLPNADVYTRAILVRTAFRHRRVVFTVGIAYGEEIEHARRVIHAQLEQTEGVLDNPGPWVYVTEFADSSVNLNVYFWTESPQKNVLLVRDRVASKIKAALQREHIEIPFPQRVITLAGTGEAEGQDESTRGGGNVRVPNRREQCIGYRLNIVGVRVFRTYCQLVAKSRDEWVTIGQPRDLPVDLPSNAEEIGDDPLLLAAYQYDSERPGSDLRDVLAQRKDFDQALGEQWANAS
jgi:small-conductance mechanosensitive channel